MEVEIGLGLAGMETREGIWDVEGYKLVLEGVSDRGGMKLGKNYVGKTLWRIWDVSGM